MIFYCDDYAKAKRNIELVCGNGAYELKNAYIKLYSDGKDIVLEREKYGYRNHVEHKYKVFVLDDRIELAAFDFMLRIVNTLFVIAMAVIQLSWGFDFIRRFVFGSEFADRTIIIPILLFAIMFICDCFLYFHFEVRPQREIKEFMQTVIDDPKRLVKNKYKKDEIDFGKMKIYLDDYEQAKINIRVFCSLGKQKINNRYGKIYHKGRDDYFEFGEKIHRTNFIWRIFVLNDRVELVLENIYKFLIPEMLIIAILAVLQSLMFCFYPVALNMASNDSTWAAAFVIAILLNITVIFFYLYHIYKDYTVKFKEAAAYITAALEKKYTLK